MKLAEVEPKSEITYDAIIKKLQTYILTHFSDRNTYLNTSDVLPSCRLSASKIPKKLYLNSLAFDEKYNFFESNLATYYLKINQNPARNEIDFISNILKQKYYKTKSKKERKCLVELIISLDHKSFLFFRKYANYLLKDRNGTISECFASWGDSCVRYSNNKFSIKIAEKLWNYAYGKNGEFWHTISNMASETFKNIINENKKSKFVFHKVLKALDRIYSKTSSDHIIRLKEQCIDKYLE